MEVGSYFSIIRAIAAGNSKLSDIAKVLEIKATSLTKYLGTLIDLDILERSYGTNSEIWSAIKNSISFISQLETIISF